VKDGSFTGLPLVSVIIPTLNGAKSIGGLLEALKGQSVFNEQIVIDSASTDDTVAIAQSWGAKTISIRREDFDHGATRNRAVIEATGDTLVFMTQDALPLNRSVIEGLVGALEAPLVAASYARQVPWPDASPPERFARTFNYPDVSLKKSEESIPELGVKTFFFSNVCSSIRRDVFNSLGGFPEGVIMDEDLLFSARAILKGYSIAYVSEAEVFHSHRYTWSQQFKRHFDIGVFFRDHAWLLEYSKINDEGIKFVKEELRFLHRTGSYLWIPYVLGELLCRYGGYKLGSSNLLMPLIFKRAASLHRGYWDKRC
jgi:rhamnosyltransferase